MTREDIIRMAREAELICDNSVTTQWIEDHDLTPYLERFAALVAAAEREAIIQTIPGGTSVDPQWVCDMIRARGIM